MEDQYADADDGLEASDQSDDAEAVLGDAATSSGDSIASPRDPAS